MDDQQLFEIAAKLLNLRPDQLRLKRRYLDVVVVEKMDGAKYTYYVADLEAMTADDRPPTTVEEESALAEEAKAATSPVAKSHTRKR